MLLVAAALALLVHGFVHLPVWLPDTGAKTADPHHSWLIGDARALSRVLAVAAAGLLALAGAGYLAGVDASGYAAIAGAAVSLVLIAVVFNRWLVLGVAINVAVIVLAVRSLA